MEDRIKKIEARLMREKGYKQVFLEILKFCCGSKTFQQIQSQTSDWPSMKCAVIQLDVLLAWLVLDGALDAVKREEVNHYQTTEEGMQALQNWKPETKLSELIKNEPDRKQIYEYLLKYCKSPKTREEIETELTSTSLIEGHSVHPVFFIQRLEKVGALKWSERRWQTVNSF